MANERLSDADLIALCDEIGGPDGKVLVSELRARAGGGSHARLSRVIDEWGRRRGAGPVRPLRPRRARRAAPPNPGPNPTSDPRPVRPAPAAGDEEDAALLAAAGRRGEIDLAACVVALRQENAMLWDLLREEREARLVEMERGNRLARAVERHFKDGNRAPSVAPSAEPVWAPGRAAR
jgi:hypothetical protein